MAEGFFDVLSAAYSFLFYAALAVFALGISYRVILYAKTPSPLKIPTMPAPTTSLGVVFRLTREAVFFESLFKSNKLLWLFAAVFHFSLLLVLIRHLRYFVDPVCSVVELLQPFGTYAAFSMVFSLLFLLGRRFFLPHIRYISAPSDYLMLLLLLLIGLTGVLMRFWSHTDVVALKFFFSDLLHFRQGMTPLPDDFLLVFHLFLVAFLLLVFPFSKLLHAPGLFFSPTRHQRDDSRDSRHTAPWALHLFESATPPLSRRGDD